MADLVKTTLLKALETSLAGITELAGIYREFDLPFDLAGVNCPALFFWETPEDIEESNLLAINTLHLSLVIFCELTGEIGDGQTPIFQAFADEADALAGLVQNLLRSRENLTAWLDLGLMELEPVAQSKALASETHGELALTYRLKYWHRLGDAYSLNLQ